MKVFKEKNTTTECSVFTKSSALDNKKVTLTIVCLVLQAGDPPALADISQHATFTYEPGKRLKWDVLMFQTGELGIQVGEEDPLGEALVELQGEVQRELNKSVREVERAHTERDNVRDLLFMFMQYVPYMYTHYIYICVYAICTIYVYTLYIYILM